MDHDDGAVRFDLGDSVVHPWPESGTGGAKQVITDIEGNYWIPPLPPACDDYVMINYPGFTPVELGPLDLDSGKTTIADLTLAPGITDGDGNPNVNGSRATGLQYRLDGGNITDPVSEGSGHGKVQAAAFLNPENLLNTDDLAIGCYNIEAFGGVGLDAGRDPGRRFELGASLVF